MTAVLITGATSGLGLATARALATDEVLVLCAGRDRGSVEAASERVGGEPVLLDLGELTEVRSAADGLPHVDAVVCNAGLQVLRGPTTTRDGFEETFQVNHLSHVVGDIVDELPEGSAVLERAQNVRELLTDLTWCQSSRGSAQVLHDQRLTGVLLVLFPNRELGHLGHSAAFQATPHQDGTLRLNVRAVSFTPLWAGLALFHELSHIHDFRSDVEPREPSTEQYLAGEARAYHLEAVLLDTLAAGRLSAELARLIHVPLTPEELATERGAALSGELERATGNPGQPPPGSNSEKGVRDVAHRIAALLAFHFNEAQLVKLQHAEAAGPAVGRFIAAAPPMEQA